MTALQRLGSELRACCADVFSLFFQEADSAAFMVARKAIEASVHSRLLVHFGKPVAALWLDDDQNTARELTRATAIDKALAGLGLTDSRTQLRPLVRAARKRIDPERRAWRAGSYWWIENTTGEWSRGSPAASTVPPSASVPSRVAALCLRPDREAGGDVIS